MQHKADRYVARSEHSAMEIN